MVNEPGIHIGHKLLLVDHDGHYALHMCYTVLQGIGVHMIQVQKGSRQQPMVSRHHNSAAFLPDDRHGTLQSKSKLSVQTCNVREGALC